MPPRHPFKQAPRDTSAHAVIEQYLDKRGIDSGFQETIPMASHRAANGGRLSIRRGARHFGISAAARVTDQAGEQCVDDCQDPDAPHALVFSLHSKATGRGYVFRQSGGRAENLKYNPHGPRA
jgi:hypothetical protein